MLKFLKTEFISRLFERGLEALPQNFLCALWVSEIFNQASRFMNKLPLLNLFSSTMQLISLKMYGYSACKVVQKNNASIYHYRAGYGGLSIKRAKKNGMVCVCDHSAIHPLLIDFMGKNGGKFPQKEKGDVLKPSKFWKYVYEDIKKADYIILNGQFAKNTFEFMNEKVENISVINIGLDQDFFNLIDFSEKNE